MKKNYRTYAFSAILTHLSLSSCPTCIGRLEKNSPPFFSEEFEKFYRHDNSRSYETMSEQEEIDE